MNLFIIRNLRYILTQFRSYNAYMRRREQTIMIEVAFLNKGGSYKIQMSEINMIKIIERNCNNKPLVWFKW